MILQQTIKPTQLPLPFYPGLLTNLAGNEREQLRLILAQLLLSAAGITLEVAADEQ